MVDAEFQAPRRATSPRITRAKARAVFAASTRTRGILPRYVCELADVPVTEGANGILQNAFWSALDNARG